MTTPPLAVAALLSAVLAWRQPSARQRTVAMSLGALLAVNVGRPFAVSALPVYVAGFVAWYAVTAACVWGVLAKEKRAATLVDGPSAVVTPERTPVPSRRATIPRAQKSESPGRQIRGSRAARWSSASILLALACYASAVAALRFDRTADLARASFALALAAQLLAALRFLARGRGADDAQRVAMILVFSSVADAFGPWLFARPGEDWQLGRWISVVTWGLIGGVSLWNLLRRRTAS